MNYYLQKIGTNFTFTKYRKTLNLQKKKKRSVKNVYS